MHLRHTIKLRFTLPFLLALFTSSFALSQSPPNIKITASPPSVFPFANITFTITVASGQRLKAVVLNPIPIGTKVVSVQQSGPPSDNCSNMGTPRDTLYCPIPFPGTETITIVLSALNPGIVADTATLVWETNTQPTRIEYVKASASVVVDPAPIVSIFSNFVLNPPCTMAAPGTCVSSNSLSVNGNMPIFEMPPFNAFTMALSFTPSMSLRLADIEVPFGTFPGPDFFDVWITADNNGSPGNVLEQFIVTNFPSGLTLQGIPPITVLPSVNHPLLTSGTQFWLVIGPGAASSYGIWSLSLSDSATPTNFLYSNTTTVGVMPLPASQWSPATTDMQTIRLAFQIDGTL